MVLKSQLVCLLFFSLSVRACGEKNPNFQKNKALLKLWQMFWNFGTLRCCFCVSISHGSEKTKYLLTHNMCFCCCIYLFPYFSVLRVQNQQQKHMLCVNIYLVFYCNEICSHNSNISNFQNFETFVTVLLFPIKLCFFGSLGFFARIHLFVWGLFNFVALTDFGVFWPHG